MNQNTQGNNPGKNEPMGQGKTNANADSKNTANAAAPSQTPPGKKEPVTALPGTKVKWPQQVKAAKSQWGKLSEAELLKSDGDAGQLSRLVQQRYNMAPEVANNQVKSFLNRSSNA